MASRAAKDFLPNFPVHFKVHRGLERFHALLGVLAEHTVHFAAVIAERVETGLHLFHVITPHVGRSTLQGSATELVDRWLFLLGGLVGRIGISTVEPS